MAKDGKPDPRIEQAMRLLDAGKLASAEALCREILSLNRRNVQALGILAGITFEQRRLEEADECLATCIRLEPMNAIHQFLASRVSHARGDYDEALARFEKCRHLRGFESVPKAWHAMLLVAKGDHAAALEQVLPRIREGNEDTDMATVYLQVALRPREGGKEMLPDALLIAQRHAAAPGADPEALRSLLFEIGAAHERLKDYDTAFDAYERANRIRVDGRTFDPAAYVKSVDAVMEVFTAEGMRTLARAGDRTELPVFIAGMPRSGTTLVEQIIDAHPRAFGAGELRDIDVMLYNLPQLASISERFPGCVRGFSTGVLDRLAKPYLEHLRRLAEPKSRRGARVERVVNKSVTNFDHLGLIEMLLPGSRVIHVLRNPMDSCFSSFAMPLNTTYGSDMKHIGLVYRQHLRLMEHWRGVLSIPILTVRYEELVADQEGVSRNIIKFLGLEWDDACLRFHESGRVVRTLSKAQVNRPIYKTSVERYRHFEKHLGPLREALG